MNTKRIFKTIVITLFLVLFVPLPWKGVNATFQPLTSFFFHEDAAHVSGDYGIAVFGLRRASSTSPVGGGSAGNDGDYQLANIDDWGSWFVHDIPASSSTPLTDLDIQYSAANQVANSRDIDPTGYRRCELTFGLGSSGVSTQEIQHYLQTKTPSGFYMNAIDGVWGKYVLDDTISAATSTFGVKFDCPLSTFRIQSVCNANCSSTNLFNESTTTLFMKN